MMDYPETSGNRPRRFLAGFRIFLLIDFFLKNHTNKKFGNLLETPRKPPRPVSGGLQIIHHWRTTWYVGEVSVKERGITKLKNCNIDVSTAQLLKVYNCKGKKRFLLSGFYLFQFGHFGVDWTGCLWSWTRIHTSLPTTIVYLPWGPSCLQNGWTSICIPHL